MKKHISLTSILYYLAGLLLLAFGIIYLTRSSFMPYHAQAVSMDWNDVPQDMQYIILALMRAIGGGYTASAVGMLFLSYQYGRTSDFRISVFTFFMGTIAGMGSAYAILTVKLNTPGEPPLFAAIAGQLLISAALIASWIRNKKME